MCPVFVSYAAVDRSSVAPFVEAMREWGVEIWMDTENLRGGDAWIDVIGQAIDVCSAFVLFLSPRAAISQVVQSEVRLAYEARKRIIPVQLQPTPVEGSLRLCLSGIHVIAAGAAALDQLRASLAAKPVTSISPAMVIARRPDTKGSIFLGLAPRWGLGRARPEVDARVNLVTRILPSAAEDVESCRQRSSLISQFHAEIMSGAAGYRITNFGKHGLSIHESDGTPIRSWASMPTSTPAQLPSSISAEDEPRLAIGESIFARGRLEFSLGRDLLRLRLECLKAPDETLRALVLRRVDNWSSHVYVMLCSRVTLAEIEGPSGAGGEELQLVAHEGCLDAQLSTGARVNVHQHLGLDRPTVLGGFELELATSAHFLGAGWNDLEGARG